MCSPEMRVSIAIASSPEDRSRRMGQSILVSKFEGCKNGKEEKRSSKKNPKNGRKKWETVWKMGREAGKGLYWVKNSLGNQRLEVLELLLSFQVSCTHGYSGTNKGITKGFQETSTGFDLKKAFLTLTRRWFLSKWFELKGSFGRFFRDL